MHTEEFRRCQSRLTLTTIDWIFPERRLNVGAAVLSGERWSAGMSPLGTAAPTLAIDPGLLA